MIHFSPITALMRRCLLFLVLGAAPWAVQAARPMLTDDARVVDTGSCQIESWVNRQASTNEPWALPACSGGAGHEWALGGNRVPHGAEAVPQWLVQYKRIWRPLEPAGLGLALSVGSQQLQSRRVPFLNLPVSWLSHDEKTLLHLNVGVARGDPGARANRTWGVAVEHRVAEAVWLMAERYATRHDRWQAQAGVRWWLIPDRLQADATVGQQQQASGSQAFRTVGLRWIFPASRP